MSTEVIQNTGHAIGAAFHPLGGLGVPQVATQDSIGVRIPQFRRDKGMTQKDLAERLGVSQAVVSDYANDVIRLPADAVVQIAQILEVTTHEILGLKAKSPTVAAAAGHQCLPKRDQEALLRTIDAFISKTS